MTRLEDSRQAASKIHSFLILLHLGTGASQRPLLPQVRTGLPSSLQPGRQEYCTVPPSLQQKRTGLMLPWMMAPGQMQAGRQEILLQGGDQLPSAPHQETGEPEIMKPGPQRNLASSPAEKIFSLQSWSWGARGLRPHWIASQRGASCKQ